MMTSFALAAVLLAGLGIYKHRGVFGGVTGAGDGQPHRAGLTARGHPAAGADFRSEAGGGSGDRCGRSRSDIQSYAQLCFPAKPIRSQDVFVPTDNSNKT